ncbi:hypothetical protein MICCA_2220002 [Microcystis aeruginosa PCC 9432]|uniref:Uncharacterized protein n=8 Tax=Microcystis TaxID=1125 RepID=A0A0F6U2H7_MICAE|nr:hypothetical protein MYAER_1183 [Microcystis aeruginosa NIES-2549]AKV68722.1 hypothetical protein VL20_3740 [Microcystis panniformis FACHB-1757]AOC51937.1 hypothetical protein amyaer_1200 [Microcystis aeruginosa NIES-2481]ARI80832.1 hypothetical protein BH695_1551 [Microcystis aeruginosa PCC 7806SL]ELP56017.1 hypothetical protein O53_616 [Microcystis aeruginosa TAIHU98]ODV36919.1 hypothetical protein BFG60_3574 [Microcystis aeruginosa NIES-98]CCH92392.1 hypothetical protein MICCA_2220002 [
MYLNIREDFKKRLKVFENTLNLNLIVSPKLLTERSIRL